MDLKMHRLNEPENYFGRSFKNLKKLISLTFILILLFEYYNYARNKIITIELSELESSRQKLQSDIEIYNKKIDNLKYKLLREQTKLERLNKSDLASQSEQKECKMSNCFDYSRCSLTSGFPIYLYDLDLYSVLNIGYNINWFLKSTIKLTLGFNPHLVNDPTSACIYLVLIGEIMTSEDKLIRNFSSNPININTLYKLPYWHGDGRNHILINLSRQDFSSITTNLLYDQNTMCAIIVQSSFMRKQYRDNYDIVVPPVLGPTGGDVWQECSHMIPARRLYLLTFQGELIPDDISDDNSNTTTFTTESLIIHLNDMAINSKQDKFLFNFKCATDQKSKLSRDQRSEITLNDWNLCGTVSSRSNILKKSIFILILPPLGGQISSVLMQVRLFEGLRSGAIPVILGHDETRLPYSETIDWQRFTIMLPKARITELYLLLSAISDTDLLAMRRQGRLIWERYFSSVQATVDTLVASLRDRLGIPPRPVQPIIAQTVFNFVPLKYHPTVATIQSNETLSSIQTPYPSPQYRRNYTVLRLQSREAWNDWFDPFNLYPQLPFDPIMSSDEHFFGSHKNFRLIGKGRTGHTGKEFREILGGNYPPEQFTIIILTYNSENFLLDILGRLYGLPYLNKVIVVWNAQKPPLDDLRWPNICVPVSVVRTSYNSLNNRFLPFNIIETEAILSIDDDSYLNHDEILFGFRVWRENRDRIVGFPGRFHSLVKNESKEWMYGDNHSCEYSMVLTGAAFFHKYYTYVYTYWLPQAIRDQVDEYMNCEDIAMNFLVSHITKKPPIKIISVISFSSRKRPEALSNRTEHYQQRSKCLNFFKKVFGYTPLLYTYTQYRSEPILTKKCFKSI